MNFYKKTTIGLFIIAALQIPISIIQRLTWNPGNTLGMMGRPLSVIDIAGGTLGWGDSTGILSCYLIGVVYIMIAYALFNKLNFSMLLLMLLMFIPIFLSQSIASFIIMPIGVLFIASRIDFKRYFAKALIFLIFIIIMAGVIYMASGKMYNYNTKVFFNPVTIFSNQSATDVFGRPQSTGKIASIIYGYALISKSITTIIFGAGLGSGSESYFASLAGKFASDIMLYEIKPQIARWLIDVGVAGVLLMAMWFCYLFNINNKVFKAVTDKFWKAVSLGFYGILFLYAAFLFYRPVLDADSTSFIFWFLSACIFSLYKNPA